MEVSGNDADLFLETVTVSDLQTLKKGKGKYCKLRISTGGGDRFCAPPPSLPEHYYTMNHESTKYWSWGAPLF